MSLYGMMRTGGSGMNAQANRLGTVAENIANSSTTGYKRASTEFASMILPSTGGAYNPGGVETNIRYSIAEEGAKTYTTSGTDLAIDGGGFFIVQDSNGQSFLTRAGAFVPVANRDSAPETSYLKNSAGFILAGVKYEDGVPPPVALNSFESLVPIELQTKGVTAKGSTTGNIGVNLARDAAVGDISTTSLSAFDTQGGSRLLDFVYEKTGTNAWSVEVRDRGTYSYSAGPPPVTTGLLGTGNLNFNTDGTLNTTSSTTSITTTAQTVGSASLNALTIDVTQTTQLSYAFNPNGGTFNGNAPNKVSDFKIDADGVLYVQYENGDLVPTYRLGMANATSPDKLIPQSGNVYSEGIESGEVIIGAAGTGNFGNIIAGALESSNVDIANELTSMIESQRSYTANSKVFQTGADLLDVLVNLKR